MVVVIHAVRSIVSISRRVRKRLNSRENNHSSYFQLLTVIVPRVEEYNIMGSKKLDLVCYDENVFESRKKLLIYNLYANDRNSNVRY